MTTTALLDDLAARGVTVTAHGDRLRCSPRSAMTPELLPTILAHKSELLAILSAKAEVAKVKMSTQVDKSKSSTPTLPGELEPPGPRPADRPGHIVELILKGGAWSWQTRRLDVADKVLQAHRRALRAEPCPWMGGDV